MSAAAQITVYTVPVNNAFILKSVLMYNTNALGLNPVVAIRTADGVTAVAIEIPALESGATSTWSGWLVLNATDYITVYANAPGINYWISGAVLPFA